MAQMPEHLMKDWHERKVVLAFKEWLEGRGWTVEIETKDFIDLVATNERGERIVAEAKGKTTGRPGAGLDTVYGQLLRRMPPEVVDDPKTRFAVVIPPTATEAALRVSQRIRDLLNIDIYTVDDDKNVELLDQSEAAHPIEKRQ